MDLQEFYLAQASKDFLSNLLEKSYDLKSDGRKISKELRENTIYIQFTYMQTRKNENNQHIVKFVLKSRRYTFIYEFNRTTKELIQKGAKEIVKVGVNGSTIRS